MQKNIWVYLRFVMGAIMLWAFLDKFLGLGFSTSQENAWIYGVSPTSGFLLHGTSGPFEDIFKLLQGSFFVDLLFMMGLLGVGVALIFGIGMRIAGYSGALMMFLIWLSVVPPNNNPILDEHVVYFFVFLGLAYSDAGDIWGFGKYWKQFKLVRKYNFLE